jgi:glycosyltransferase involved in cell wall biosynthesis
LLRRLAEAVMPRQDRYMKDLSRKEVLVVSPFSGRGVGGGLATFNQELTRALAAFCEVTLLTMQLPESLNPKQADHGDVAIVTIRNDKSSGMTQVGKNDEDRDLLYELLFDAVSRARKPEDLGLPRGWDPKIIIGHSRFSGAAAVLLRENIYEKAKVAYILHSAPIEGTFMTGLTDRFIKRDAEGRMIQQDELARNWEKIAAEMEWMPRAHLVVGVGPLLRKAAQGLALWGALAQDREKMPMVYELVPGTHLGELVSMPSTLGNATYSQSAPFRLLLLGRAGAPIKGLDDVIRAVRYMRTEGMASVTLRVRGFAEDAVGTASEWATFMAANNMAANDIEILPSTSQVEQIAEDIRSSHAVLMPSHFEHFGLVALEAAGYGVPILVNEDSGAGMFLADATRISAEVGAGCVVKDSGQAAIRPELWAKAIDALCKDIVGRFRRAAALREILARYSWDNAARALIDATAKEEFVTLVRSIVQGPDGVVKRREGPGVLW